MKWLRRRPRPDPAPVQAAEEAARNVADAERSYRDTLRQWPEVLEVAEKAREQAERNHFAESVNLIFRGRK